MRMKNLRKIIGKIIILLDNCECIPDPSLFVLIVGGSRELATDKFSTVTIDGSGGGEGKISPTGAEQEGGPEVHPIQLQVT